MERPVNSKKERCCERVRDRGMNWPTYHQCKRWAVVKRRGKPYCKLHDPEAVRTRRDAQCRAFSERIKRTVFGSYAPALFELLKESQTSTGPDWQKRRDKLLRKLQGQAP